MDELLKIALSASIRATSAIIAFLAYLAGRRRQTRASQIEYLQTVFQYDAIPRYFSYSIWNVHFLANLGRFFEDLLVHDDGLKRIDPQNNLHKRVIAEILAYVAVQASEVVDASRKASIEPPELDAFLSEADLVKDRLLFTNIAESFRERLGECGDPELRKKMNQFIAREQSRICDRTSYMSFLLPFACLPGARDRLTRVIDDREILNGRKWPIVERMLEEFLRGKVARKKKSS